MIRTILWSIYVLFYLIALIPKFLRAKYLHNHNQIEASSTLTHNVAHHLSRAIISAAGGKIKVIGEENIPKDQAVLFVSNHQGNFDIPTLIGFIDKPKGFVAKVEIQKIPMIATWMTYMQCVFIDRQDIRQSLKAINEAADYLKAGHSMVIFPEGTRSKSGTMGEFKPGSIKLALKAEAPIVPVTIKGSYNLMEARGKITPAEVEVIISKPLSTAGLSKEEAAELPDKIRDIIASNL